MSSLRRWPKYSTDESSRFRVEHSSDTASEQILVSTSEGQGPRGVAHPSRTLSLHTECVTELPPSDGAKKGARRFSAPRRCADGACGRETGARGRGHAGDPQPQSSDNEAGWRRRFFEKIVSRCVTSKQRASVQVTLQPRSQRNRRYTTKQVNRCSIHFCFHFFFSLSRCWSLSNVKQGVAANKLSSALF